MDPRPYHFEFRKPRFSNPTFQSNNLYDSMYQLNKNLPKNTQLNRYKMPQTKKPLSEPDQVKRHQSVDLPKPQKLEINRFSSRNQASYQKQKTQPPPPPLTQRTRSQLSNYGYNLMRADEASSIGRAMMKVDQRQVFDKQQHAFDIINYKPTQYRARLKMFPKLTLQDRINQRYGDPTVRGKS